MECAQLAAAFENQGRPKAQATRFSPDRRTFSLFSSASPGGAHTETAHGKANYSHVTQRVLDTLHRMKCMPKCFTTPSRVTLPCLVFAVGSVLVADPKAAAASEKAFAGRWDLTISDPSNQQLPSWLELSVEKGAWKANFVGRWGNARLLPKVVINGDLIQFVSPKEEEASKTWSSMGS